MHLKLGSRVCVAIARSHVPTHGIGTKSQQHLEEQELDSNFSSSFELGSKLMDKSRDMYGHMGNKEHGKGAETSHVNATPSYQMDFNTKLKLDYTSTWGTEIYHNLLQRYVYKIGKCLTPFEKTNWVN